MKSALPIAFARDATGGYSRQNGSRVMRNDLYEPHSGEFITFEGTREELMDVARSYDRLYDIGDFPWRVARTIAEELGEYLL